MPRVLKGAGRRGDKASGPGRRRAATSLRWPLAIVAGVLSATVFTAVPPLPLLLFVMMLGAMLLGSHRLRVFGLGGVVLAATLLQYGHRLEDRLDGRHARAAVEVTGVVSSVPERQPGMLRFLFEPEGGTAAIALPSTLRVSWFGDDLPELAAGERWRLELSLQPPWGRVNFAGGDPERWLFANGIGALGTVRDGRTVEPPRGFTAAVDRLRQRVREAIERNLDEGRGRAVVTALAIADRSALDDTVRRILADTGTAHLLAISGLHVGLAATAGFWVTRLLLTPFAFARRGRRLLHGAAAGGIAAALAYALLADLGVSTLRAVVMVGAALALLLTSRSTGPAVPLAWAAAVVLLADPFAPLGAGFWFSFVAVAALLAAFAPRRGRLPAWRRPLLAQAAVMIAVLPVSAAWFGLASAASLPANLLAIPWVSIVVVPAVLGGIALLPFGEGLAAASWALAGAASEGLLAFLGRVVALGPSPFAVTSPGTTHLVLALAGAFLLLLPGALRWKWLGAFLLLPLLLPSARPVAHDEITFEVLDAGQGTAAVLRSAGHTLLYDSGPGDGATRNLARAVIAPALGGARPDRVVISHGDLDHAGGLATLRGLYPEAGFRVNDGKGSADTACTTGWAWRGGDTVFRALHPSSGLPYLGNDSSCALSVTGPGGRVLLPGDISLPIEQRLVAEGLAPHDVLLVPHHGSRSSSGAEFLAAVRPRLAIATAALGNRFGFPREDVAARYRDAGIPLLTTGECGALRVRLRAGEIASVDSARRARPRPWRWPAAARCP